ncbi:hypothetical protein [Actinacidiphila acidipaludis]|uniref:Uncharacterized protein n=1 Tax=Actinacidiphila acidipaludis TaxID=2873382 RepID=A0ABS7QAD3_9ACTN|nr:hypothetical protein [Streptomyces acidipaludis]MBY8880130.1 hypothetical protein [Streptomyces acidipaludis]
MLRRHHQAVLPPDFPAPRDGVTAWQRGDPDVPPAPTGSVASWTAVLRDYAALLAPAGHAGHAGVLAG